MSQHHILYALEDKPGFMVSLTAAAVGVAKKEPVTTTAQRH